MAVELNEISSWWSGIPILGDDAFQASCVFGAITIWVFIGLALWIQHRRKEVLFGSLDDIIESNILPEEIKENALILKAIQNLRCTLITLGKEEKDRIIESLKFDIAIQVKKVNGKVIHDKFINLVDELSNQIRNPDIICKRAYEHMGDILLNKIQKIKPPKK
ncbi:MAG: hypothetical protein ACKVT0_15455 [Planctomycetaceae bacterium]